jgi:hypothetical protein
MKDWNHSRTVIINGLSLIIALATLLSGDALGLPPEVAHYAALVLAITNVVNLWLRSQTDSALRLPGQPTLPNTEGETNGTGNS